MVAPQAKKTCSRMLMKDYKLSERKECSLAGANRSTVRYSSKRDKKKTLEQKIKEIALENRRYGYRRIHRVLRRQKWQVNHKAVYRIYRSLGLKVLKRSGRKRSPQPRVPEDRGGAWVEWAVSIGSSKRSYPRQRKTRDNPE